MQSAGVVSKAVFGALEGRMRVRGREGSRCPFKFQPSQILASGNSNRMVPKTHGKWKQKMIMKCVCL